MREAYLTADLPGIGGELRHKHEDFEVEELPLYAPCGEGEHVFVRIRKRGLSTFEAVRRIARDLRIPERWISYAGLKDARAVAWQWLSIHGVDPEAVASLRYKYIHIDRVARHTNRLKIGHLRGNRFRLRVHNCHPDALERARAILDVLVSRGAPNFFGEQRFGIRADGHLIGEALLRRDHEEFVRRLLGRPSELERDERLCESRRLFDAGRIEEAYEAMPLTRRIEKKSLHALIRFGDYERAYFAVPKRMRQMFASAYQSHLFNRIVEERLDELDRIKQGELAYLHHNGAVFVVEDVAREQERCRAFEISPSGPIFGTKVSIAGGEVGEIERRILAGANLTPESFDVGGGMRLRGLRRSLRIPLRNIVIDKVNAESVRIEFFLPSGSFATSVMREIMKDDDGKGPQQRLN